METILKLLSQKLFQYAISIAGGFLVALETSIPFFIPCLVITCLDIYSAYCLGRRVHKKYPDKSDGKFKSEYKFRILYTMIIVFLAIVLANYVDIYVIKNTDAAVRFVLGMFFFYQGISILENWSSENDNKFAVVLQAILINKAERHFNIDLTGLKKEEKDNDNK